jgi:hypothetical protein
LKQRKLGSAVEKDKGLTIRLWSAEIINPPEPEECPHGLCNYRASGCQDATYLVYPAGNKASLTKKINSWGEEAYYYPFRGIVGRNVPLSVVAFFISFPLALIYLIVFLKTKKIDTINCHYLSQYLINFVIAAKVAKTQLIVSVHGADIDRFKEKNF